MKLKLYTTILLTGLAVTANAQKADTAQIVVHYKFTHVRDTTNRDKPLNENMVLMVGRNASAYKSYDRKLREEQARKAIMDQISSGSTNIKVTNAGGPMSPNIDYFQYPNDNKLYINERVVNNYVIEEVMPVLAWKITADTTTLNGLQCQKATTHFKGRDYTAWFCADLPYRVGPWKLNGLPGLIVEAYDAKKDVIFKFDGLEKVDPNAKAAKQPELPGAPGRTIVIGGIGGDNNQEPNVIALAKNAIRTTPKELNELKEIMRKDPQAFFQSQMAAAQGQMSGASRSFSMNSGGGAGSPVISSVNVQRAPGGTTVVVNNPIELPEKGDKK